jgi:hypothetical protein
VADVEISADLINNFAKIHFLFSRNTPLPKEESMAINFSVSAKRQTLTS